jgi:hypothetical protein
MLKENKMEITSDTIFKVRAWDVESEGQIHPWLENELKNESTGKWKLVHVVPHITKHENLLFHYFVYDN